MQRRYLKAASFALLVLLLVGILAVVAGPPATRPASSAGTTRSADAYSPLSKGSRAPVDAGSAGSTAGTEAATAYSIPGGNPGGAMAEAPTTTTAAASTDAPASSGSYPSDNPELSYGSQPQQNYQSSLTAGQVDDNARFADYLNYINSYQGTPVHPIPVDRRFFVRVLDSQQHPVAGARVQLFDGDRQVFDGTTVSDGSVLFFPETANATQAQEFRAIVSRGQQQVQAALKAGALDQTVSMPTLRDNTGPVNLDLVFLLDSTGSMGDEIDKIKGTVDSIATRIEQLPGSTKPRFGLVTYRDRGDDYVTRSWDFTSDIQQFSENLSTVQAGGGGDVPESVNTGLHDAIHLPGWADDSTGRHLRMIVLVGDAPPHLDYPNDYEYTQLLQEAVAAGIKIFPIGASGLDDQGEYIFRQFAQVTQGQFVFLTYANGVSGAPGVATDHHVSDFTVQNLDNLVVGLVAGEIANQTGNAPQASSQQEQVTLSLPQSVLPVSNSLPDTSATFWLAIVGLVVLVVLSSRTVQKARYAGPTQIRGLPSPGEDLMTPEPNLEPDLLRPESDAGQPTIALPPLPAYLREKEMAEVSKR